MQKFDLVVMQQLTVTRIAKTMMTTSIAKDNDANSDQNRKSHKHGNAVLTGALQQLHPASSSVRNDDRSIGHKRQNQEDVALELWHRVDSKLQCSGCTILAAGTAKQGMATELWHSGGTAAISQLSSTGIRRSKKINQQQQQ